MDIAERPTGVGNRKHMETPHVESTSEKGIPGDLQDDILRGDLPTHEKQLRRSMQYSNADFSGSNSAMKFQQVPQLWEGSTRFHGNLDLHAGPNIPYPFGLTMPLYPSHERMAEGLHTPRSFPVHDSVCTLPKSRNGTGTYIPKPVRFYYLFVSCESFNCNALAISMDLYARAFSFFLATFWGKMLSTMRG